jgi:hypothetical protein
MISPSKILHENKLKMSACSVFLNKLSFDNTGQKNLVKRFLDLPGHQDCFQSIRSLIVDVFKLTKDAFSLQKFPRYTTRSFKKAVILNVLLSGPVISFGFRSTRKL